MRTQFGKIRRESNVCVLCTRNPATTKEHVPPQGLFLQLPHDYLAVPACLECNDSTKLDDEYLRNVMTGAAHTDEALAVWRQKVRPKLRAFPKTRAGLANQLAQGVITIPKVGSAPVPILRVDASRLQVSTRKMVGGLFWFHTGNLLPATDLLTLHFLNVAEVAPHFRNPENARIFKMTRAGIYRDPAVVRTFFYSFATTPSNSLWYFMFYRQNVLIAYCDKEVARVAEPSNHGIQPPAGSGP